MFFFCVCGTERTFSLPFFFSNVSPLLSKNVFQNEVTYKRKTGAVSHINKPNYCHAKLCEGKFSRVLFSKPLLCLIVNNTQQGFPLPALQKTSMSNDFG